MYPLLLLLLSLKIEAETYYSFDLGIGIGNLFHSRSEFLKYSATFRYNNFVLQGRVVDMQNLFGGAAVSSGQFLDAGILPGYMVNINDMIRISFVVGLSFVYCNKKRNGPDVSSPTDRTVGIPFSVDFLVFPLQKFGMGISFTGNVNAPNPSIGTALSFYYGKLR